MSAFLGGILIVIIVAVYSSRKGYDSLTVLTVGWLWVITMQLWEFFAWKRSGLWASRAAYVFNMTQILFLFLVFLVFREESVTFNHIVIAFVVVLLTTCVLFYPTDTIEIGETRDHHLRYSWWSLPIKSTVYIIGLAVVFLLMVRPLKWSVACVSVLILLLCVSVVFYPKAVPSLWCFFAVPFPLIALGLRSLLPE